MCPRPFKITACTILALVLSAIDAAAQNPKPQNYDEVKAMLDAYAMADDMMDQDLLDARNRLHGKGAEVVPALIYLFGENTDDHYRCAIVDALWRNKGPKQAAVAFLAGQLAGQAKDWHGYVWVYTAIQFLTEADPEQARGVDVRALDSKEALVQCAAIDSLAQIGTKQEVPPLKSYIAREKSADKHPYQFSMFVRGAEALKQILVRVARDGNLDEFSTVTAVPGGIKIKFKPGGMRFNMKIGDSPREISRYGATVEIPFGGQAEFVEKHFMIFVVVDTAHPDSGFIVTKVMDNSSAGGNIVAESFTLTSSDGAIAYGPAGKKPQP